MFNYCSNKYSFAQLYLHYKNLFIAKFKLLAYKIKEISSKNLV